MTDIYFLDLARNMLHKAIGSLLDVQKYLRDAGLPSELHETGKHIYAIQLQIVRLIEENRNDRINDQITTEEEHEYRELHKALDKLVADYIFHNKELLTDTVILEIAIWSAKQKDNPTL